MARLKRSKKAGSPPSPVRGFKVPKTAKRTESAPDMRANRRLSQSRAKPIAGHIRATTKRRQAKRDSRLRKSSSQVDGCQSQSSCIVKIQRADGRMRSGDPIPRR